MKPFIIIAVVVVTLFIVIKKQSSFRTPPPNLNTEQQTTPIPVTKDECWQETSGDDSTYKWFTPTTSGQTKNFVIQNYRTTYRIFTSCIQEFVEADGKVITAFKVDIEKEQNFLEIPTGSGNFANEPWPISEHTKAWKQAKWVRFRPLVNSSIDLKVGRK